MSRSKQFSLFEKFILRKFYPRKIFFDAVGSIWAVYFLWNHEWQGALVVTVAASLLGILSVWNIDLEKMSETLLGKLALLHLNPFNLATQIIGVAMGVYGIWIHSTETILAAISIILIGHIFGWEKVDSRLKIVSDQ